MKKFFRDIALFFIPLYLIILWAIVPVIVLYSYSEMYILPDRLVNDDSRKLIGFGYKQDFIEKYKWHNLRESDPFDVLALGSSRVLHFREEMFSTTFFNAGYSIRNLGELTTYMKSIGAQNHPKLLIVGLDQWLFNSARPESVEPRPTSVWTDWNTFNTDFTLLSNVWSDIVSGKFKHPIEDTTGIKFIGLNAHFYSRGIRNDGSIDYGVDIQYLIDEDPDFLSSRLNDMIDRINEGSNRFEFGESVNSEAIDVLDHFLDYCNSHNIKVIGYLPPYADFTIELFNESGNHKYLEHVYEGVLPAFEKNGFEIYDFTTLESIGSDDSEILDGFHVAEVGYLKKLITIVEQNPESVLSDYIDYDQLISDLYNRHNRLIIYDY